MEVEQFWISYSQGIFLILPKIIRTKQGMVNPDAPELFVQRGDPPEHFGAVLRHALEHYVIDHSTTGWPANLREVSSRVETAAEMKRTSMAKLAGLSKTKLRKIFHEIWLRFDDDRIYFRSMLPDREYNDWGVFASNEDLEKEPWLPATASNTEIGQKLFDWADAKDVVPNQR
jgi:hypothetical protein